MCNIYTVGKLLRNTPKGLQPTGKAALKSREPSFEPPSMVQLDSATIEKMLNQNKGLTDGDDKNHDTNVNCVPLPAPENCSHSDDPMCHDEGILFNTYHDRGPYQIETSQLISTANQWTGFYMIGSSVMKELAHFISMFSFISIIFQYCAVLAGEHWKALEFMETLTRNGWTYIFTTPEPYLEPSQTS